MKKLIHRSPSVETLEARSLLTASPLGHALGMPHAAFGPLPGRLIHAANLPGMPVSRRGWAAAWRAERAALPQANLLRLQEMRSAFWSASMRPVAVTAPIVAAPDPLPVGLPTVISPPPVAGSITPPTPASPSLVTVGPPATVPVPLPSTSMPPAAPIVANLNGSVPTNPPAAPIAMPPTAPAPTSLPAAPIAMPPAAPIAMPPAAPIAMPPTAPAPTDADSPIVDPTAGIVSEPEPVLPGGSGDQTEPGATPTGGASITLGADGTAQISGTLTEPGSSDVYTFQAPSSGRLTFAFAGGGDPVRLTARAADGTALLTILLDRPNFVSFITVTSGASYTFTLDPIGSTPASYAVTTSLS